MTQLIRNRHAIHKVNHLLSHRNSSAMGEEYDMDQTREKSSMLSNQRVPSLSLQEVSMRSGINHLIGRVAVTLILLTMLTIGSSICGIIYSPILIAQSTDTDSDSVLDSVDLDDDNDGIPDAVECVIEVGNKPVAVVNGSFEEPDLVRQSAKITKQWGALPTAAVLFDESSIDGWATSASDNQIEYWRTGFSGVDAHHGIQFAEINANSTASLYQEIATTPGEVMTWSFAHRGRTGDDTIALKVGPIDGPYVAINTFTTGNSAWSVYSGEYTVPVGQTVTRFFYEAISTANGNTSMGNFLDDIRFYIKSSTCTTDTDSDGIVNSLDLDSDGDGIPDNIEAQSTTDHIPSAGGVSTEGILTVYDSGISPINTDGADEPDYLDTDSDNDGSLDSSESGLTPGADGDDDGIGDGIGASYVDANGSIDSPDSQLTDLDNDVNGEGDVDYRDAEVDVTGLADSFECGSIFYQVINDKSEGEGQLYKLDPATGEYTPIGNNSGFTYNAMGYNPNDNFLYAIANDKRLDGATDSLGNVLTRGDLIKVDAGGETFRVGYTGFPKASYSADIVGNELWIRTGSRQFARVNLSTGEGTAVTLTGSLGAADVVVVGTKLYGVNNNLLYSIDTAATEPIPVNVYPITNMDYRSKFFGAIWATEKNGTKEIFVSNNGTGEINRIDGYDTVSPRATLIVQAQATGSNDGASCPVAAPPQFPSLQDASYLIIDDITLQPALCGVDTSKGHATAWNSVGYSAAYYDTKLQSQITLLAAEPFKTGVEMIAPEMQAVLTTQLWVDNDGNGIKDGGEPAIRGVRARIYKQGNSTAVVGTNGDAKLAVTSDRGELIFQGLEPDTDYVIRLDDPKNFQANGPLGNFSLGMQNNLNVLRGAESNAINASLAIYGDDGYPEINARTGGPGTEVNINSFNLISPATIGDMIWDDTDGNGIREYEEYGMQNVIVNLLNSAGVPIMTTTSDAGGNYLFEDVAPGIYSIEFDLSALSEAYTYSPAHVSGNPETDSDVNSAGRTAQFVAESGDIIYGIDAGLVTPESSPASISGIAWEDENQNGTREGTEVTIANLTVYLMDSIGLPIDVVQTTSTGAYEFGNLKPGVIYQVVFAPNVAQTITPLQNAGDDTTDSDANPATGETTAVTPVDNQLITNVDVGIVSKLSLGNRVWLDANNNGQQDEGEGGLEGFTIRLLDANNAELRQTTTDATGRYLFTDLDAGTYTIQVDALDGYISSNDISSSSTPNQLDKDDNGLVGDDEQVRAVITLTASGGNADDANHSEEDHGEPINGRIDPNTNGKAYYTIDFGFYRPVSVGNLVWLDDNQGNMSDETDNNGRYEAGAGEAPIADVVVEAWLDDGDGIFDENTDGAMAGTPDGSATTDQEGSYLISELAPGSYWIVVPASNFDDEKALSGLVSSFGAGDANDNAMTSDNQDDGEDVTSNGAIYSRSMVVLSSGLEVGNNVSTVGNGTVGDISLMVDFGFIPAPVEAVARNEAGEIIPEEGLPGESDTDASALKVETLDQPEELEISNPENERANGGTSSVYLPYMP